MYFALCAVGMSKVTTYDGKGNKTTDSYATFNTSDRFHGNEGKTTTPKVQFESSTMFYSDDDGRTWSSITNKETLTHKYYGFNLAGLDTTGVWVYIPMSEFFYYGGWQGSGEGSGLNGRYKGFTTFQEGVEILKATGSTALHSFQLIYKPNYHYLHPSRSAE